MLVSGVIVHVCLCALDVSLTMFMCVVSAGQGVCLSLWGDCLPVVCVHMKLSVCIRNVSCECVRMCV